MRVCTKCLIEKPPTEFRDRPSRRTSRCKSCEAEYQRSYYWANPERSRAKSANSMRKMRADPKWLDAHLVKRRRDWRAKWRKKEQAYHALYREQHPWEWRVRNLKRNISKEITVEWLRAVWARQDGKCALSGRPLDIRTAEVDHILPISRGGTHDLRNLRLVVSEANYAKHGMTDEELLALCRDIIAQSQIPELIGRAILERAA